MGEGVYKQLAESMRRQVVNPERKPEETVREVKHEAEARASEKRAIRESNRPIINRLKRNPALDHQRAWEQKHDA